MARARPWQILVLAAQRRGDRIAGLRQAAAAAADLAAAGSNTRLLYPRATLPRAPGSDPFALLDAEPAFGLIGLPAPGWSSRSRQIGFALNALLYVSALSGPQILFVTDLAVWSWLRPLLRRRRKWLVLELATGIDPDPEWARAAVQADGVVCQRPVQFEALADAGVPASRIFLAADRKALVRQIRECRGGRDR